MKTSHWSSTIAYLNVITEIVDIIIKHLFLTLITLHTRLYFFCLFFLSTTNACLHRNYDANV